MQNYLDGIELYTQQGEAWKGEIMTFPTYQDKPDILKKYGCLVVAINNAVNLNAGRIVYSPKTLNMMIKKKKGYRYLADPENCKGKESYVVWSVVEKLLNGLVDSAFEGAIEIEHPDRFYIANVKSGSDSHYCLVLGGEREKIKYHDSYSGSTKRGKAYQIIRIEFAK